MFTNLTSRFADTFRNLTGRSHLTPENMRDTLSQIRIALLEADVSLPVVKEFIAHIEEAATGQKIIQSLSPGETLTKIVQDELISALGTANVPLNLDTSSPPEIIFLVGLQGSGKTTTAAKLAALLKETQMKKVLLVSVDVHRPAAREQLEILASQIKVDFYASREKSPLIIAENALQYAKTQFYDVVIIDTAGRLHVDQELMTELAACQSALNPVETLIVLDSMTGQDAINVAKNFHQAIKLTGVILTKTDGDSRGGAALSMRMATSQPIKFIGTGEKIHALEAFHPQGIASRILGMGDIVSLVEEVQRKTDQKTAEKLADKIHKGKKFTLLDFKNQLGQLKNMGDLNSMLKKLPGIQRLGNIDSQHLVDTKLLDKMEAIINSMTEKERIFPDVIIKGSHKRRIAQGSGTNIQDVNKLLKQFEQMQKMLKQMKGNKIAHMMKNFL